MSRPVVTAILLEDLRRTGQEIRLPTGALITPAARDWMKEHPVPITWEETKDGTGSLAAVMDTSLAELRSVRTMLDRRGGLADVIEPKNGRAGMAAATRRLCGQIARKEATRGVVIAQDAALPVVIANKHVGVRAALGTDIPTVEQACRELGINVLVIEYPTKTVFQMRQMIDRMMAGATSPHAEIAATIENIEQGGGRADW